DRGRAASRLTATILMGWLATCDRKRLDERLSCGNRAGPQRIDAPGGPAPGVDTEGLAAQRSVRLRVTGGVAGEDGDVRLLRSTGAGRVGRGTVGDGDAEGIDPGRDSWRKRPVNDAGQRIDDQP